MSLKALTLAQLAVLHPRPAGTSFNDWLSAITAGNRAVVISHEAAQDPAQMTDAAGRAVKAGVPLVIDNSAALSGRVVISRDDARDHQKYVAALARARESGQGFPEVIDPPSAVAAAEAAGRVQISREDARDNRKYMAAMERAKAAGQGIPDVVG